MENLKYVVDGDKIMGYIEGLYNPDDIGVMIDAGIHNYADHEQMEDENIESEYDWYQDYGRGESESDIHDGIIRKVEIFIGEKVDKWYYNDKYGDVDKMIYKCYPELEVR